MSTCTSPVIYGVPAHLAVDVTPKPDRIRSADFIDDYVRGYLVEARAYRDCARLGMKHSTQEVTSGDPKVRVSSLARKIMLAWMRSTARVAVAEVRRQKGLARESWR